MKQRLSQIGVALVGILLCLVVAIMQPPMYSEDVYSVDITFVALLILMSALLHGGAKWPCLNLCIAMIAAVTIMDIFIFCIVWICARNDIMYVTGLQNILFRGFVEFWLPWLLGLGIGSLWLRKKGGNPGCIGDQSEAQPNLQIKDRLV